MFKVNGAYANEIADDIAQLNEIAKRIENFTVDSDTQGSLIESLRDLNKSSGEMVSCLIQMQHKLVEIVYNLKQAN